MAAIRFVIMAIVIAAVLLFLGVVTLVIIHVCIVGRAFSRGFEEPERFDRSSRSMSRDDLQKLPCYDYKAKDKGNSSPVDCAVCLENFKMGEKCRLLPQCSHSFHAECVDSWLLRNPICPICRTSADSGKDGDVVVLGEEISHLSENDVELGDSQSREDVRIEIRECTSNSSGHESRESQTVL